MNMRDSESKIWLIKDSEWSVIDGAPCRVSDFSPLSSFVDARGKVVSADRTTPYATITMECKQLGKNITGCITHKMDFQHLWAAFKERTVKEGEEVIIYWTKEHYKGAAKFASRIASPVMPKLWVMVCPKGAFELITDIYHKPELTGEARWNAMKPIIDWKPEVIDLTIENLPYRILDRILASSRKSSKDRAIIEGKYFAKYRDVPDRESVQRLLDEYASGDTILEPMRNQFTEAEQEELYMLIDQSNLLSRQEKIEAIIGLMMVLDGMFPEPPIVSRLGQVLGEGFVEAIEKKRGEFKTDIAEKEID